MVAWWSHMDAFLLHYGKVNDCKNLNENMKCELVLSTCTALFIDALKLCYNTLVEEPFFFRAYVLVVVGTKISS